MKNCKACNLRVMDDAVLCPLCGTALEGPSGEAPGKNSYPVIAESFYKYNFLFRLFLFLSIVAVSVCLLVDFLTQRAGLSWSIIVLSGIAYLWVTIAYSLRGTGNFATKYAVQVLSISAVLYIIDYYAGYTKWSVNYTIPFFLILATFAITFLIVFKRVDRHDYLFCQLVIGAFGLIPLIFLPLGLLDVLWPAISSAAYSLLTLAGTAIFGDRYVRHELNKRFHV